MFELENPLEMEDFSLPLLTRLFFRYVLLFWTSLVSSFALAISVSFVSSRKMRVIVHFSRESESRSGDETNRKKAELSLLSRDSRINVNFRQSKARREGGTLDSG